MHRERSGEGQEFLYVYKLCQNKNAITTKMVIKQNCRKTIKQ